MKVYKFRLLTEEQDGFIREIEVKSDQTFKDLHEFIVKTFKFKSKELASFYIANENWEKLIEITLLDMSGEVDNGLKTDDQVQTIFIMAETILDRFLDEVGQKMIYEYDFLQMQTFQLELISISDGGKKSIYPKVTYSRGKLDKQEGLVVEKDSEKLKAELLHEFNSILKDDDDDDDDYFGDDDY
ncbi:MAG: hypothetical protein B6D64_13465 [Bacteroidetes bacterium 4484_276]|nr:MAG: hypothetical protein B6D64_13465 [Bacteroidetes bacterium 4484_276]OYT12924.1 MAG: hypothetical protein B6I19_07795 [Bacteroidetes bacterium 4572_114]